MNPNPHTLIAALALAAALPAAAGESMATQTLAEPPPSTWDSLNDWSVAGILFPRLDLIGVGGWTDGEAGLLSEGEHDPQRQTFSAQSLEPGISLRTQYLEGFANGVIFQDGEGDWEAEWEEAFLKAVNLPGGFEIKGGQYLAHFGAANRNHLHAWDYVDSEFVYSRFLGSHGLMLRGVNLDWTLPINSPSFTSVASLGFAPEARGSHDHSHGGHDHHHDHHDDHEAAFESEEAWMEDDIWTARLMGRYRLNDFNQFTGGVSFATGDNGFGRNTRVGGIDLEYLWRENGLEPGGRAFRWRNEAMVRRVQAVGEGEHDDHDDHDHHDHHDHHDDDHDEIMSGTFKEWGLHTSAVYTWNDHWDTALRLGWVEGVSEFDLAERFRISPSVTYYPDSDRRLGLRVQYNYDDLRGEGDAHSVWFQVRLSLGSQIEVR